MKKLAWITVLSGLMLALPKAVASGPETARLSTNNPLKNTVVLRVDNRDGSRALLNAARPSNEKAAVALAQNGSEFKAVAQATGGRSELDQDGGTSSWYFVYPTYYPNYYGSYAYSPYGSYGYTPYGLYNPYYYYPTVAAASVYPTYYYYGNAYSPYYVYNYGPYTYYYYGYGW